MQRKSHTTVATALIGAVLAFTVVAPGAFATPMPQPPAFPSAVPSQPGQLTGTAAAIQSARAQERYYSSYGHSKPLASPVAPVQSSGTDWATIGISLGATCLLVGALITLGARTRRRTHRVRVAA